MSVTVVGAGIAGLACARTLAAAGVSVRVLERTGSVGGRLARTECPPIGRRVEWGAAYLTGFGDHIGPLVDRWRRRGLLQPWTDTFSLADGTGLTGSTTGPLRLVAPSGLRSLARDLSEGLDVAHGVTVAAVDDARRDPAETVVLAVPRPQAAALVCNPDAAPELSAVRADIESQGWESVTVTVAVFESRTWPDFGAAFVNGPPSLRLIVDDGDRVGDRAPVLVLYAPGRPTPWFLGAGPAEPSEADVAATVDAARRILGLPRPAWTRSRVWRLAQPAAPEPRPFGHYPDSGLAVVGDGWAGKPRIGAALASGIAAARQLILDAAILG